MSPCGGADAPLVLTERLALWRPAVGDLPDLVAMVAPEPVHRFLTPGVAGPAAQFERLVRNAGSWALYGYGMFCVRPRAGGPVIATCGVFHSWRALGHGLEDVPEAGWTVAHANWRQGVAGEAMRAALAWFDASHPAARVRCMIVSANAASIRLAAALGFAEYDRVAEADGVEIVLYERA